jgi:hypothetical protein
MRDTFYCWFYLALWLAICLGAAIARAGMGQVDWYDITMTAALGIMSTAAAIDHYRKRRPAPPKQERKDNQ